MSATRPWYDAAFERGYLDLYPHRDLASARREIAGLVERGLAGRVLDLGCGYGRHALALRAAGLDVFGLDRSADLLLHAPRVAGGEALAGRLVRGDFRRLPFRARSFDAVLMLFSSFGYFDDGENAAVLGELVRVLAAGGTAVLDLMNPARVRATLVPESRSECAGSVLHERRRLAEDGRRVRKDVRAVAPDGSERVWHEDVRLYEPDELRTLLEAHGLALLRVEGDFDGTPPGPDAPRQIAWAQVPGGAREGRGG